MYLKHPRSVLSVEWRNSPKKGQLVKKRTQLQTFSLTVSHNKPNVLLTTCLDNVCRLWRENVVSTDTFDFVKRPLSIFQMATVIDAAEFTSMVSSSISPISERIGSPPVVSFTPAILQANSPIEMLRNPSSQTTSSMGILQHREHCALHFLNSTELIKAIQSREEYEMNFLKKRKKNVTEAAFALASRRNRRLIDTFKEYPDVLFHVNADGTMVFWGVQV